MDPTDDRGGNDAVWPVDEASSRRVLIVDDDGEIRHALRLLFELDGFDVVGEAADGYTGIRIAEQEQPDFVVLDYRMPLLDGATAAHVIRSVSADSKIIAFSAYIEDRPAWADAYLNKERMAEIAPLLAGFVDMKSASDLEELGMAATSEHAPLQTIEEIAHELRGSAWMIEGFLEKLIQAGNRYDDHERTELLLLGLHHVERMGAAVDKLELARKHLDKERR